MPTSYSSLLGLALPVQGELAGSWGNVVNTSITELLDTAVAGTTTLSTDADVTLTDTTGASNQSRQAILMCTGARTVLRTVTAPARSKLYIVNNATTGGYGVKIVGVGPTTGVTVVAGETAVVAWNGTDFVKIAGQNGAYSFTGSVFNGTVGATTPSTGAFTTLSASSTVSGAGFVSRFSAPGAIGDVTPSTGAFTTLSASGDATFGTGQANPIVLVKSSVAAGGAGISNLYFANTTLDYQGYVQYNHALNKMILGAEGGPIVEATVSGLQVTGAVSSGSGFFTGAGAAGGSGTVVSATNNKAYVGGVVIGDFSSTGLSVTGALSATGGADFSSTGGVSPFRALKTGVAQFLLGNGGTSNSYLDSDNIYLRSGNAGTTFGTFSSTGLAVTGALSSTGRVKADSTDGFYLDQFGVRSWSMTATGGNFNLNSGDGLGSISFNGGKLLLDGPGNLGLGVTPSAWATYKAIDITGGTSVDGSGALGFNTYYNGANYIYKISTQASLYSLANGQHRWYTAPSGTAGNAITFTQAMTLDASGNLLVGTSSLSINPGVAIYGPIADAQIQIGHSTGAASGSPYHVFKYDSSNIGSITQNGTTAVAYNTTSDHRLKTNVRPADAARFMDIEFVDFEWTDGRHDCGVIAHQLASVYPDLVLGEKDATEVRTVEITPAVPAVLGEDGNVITPAIPAVTQEQTFPVYQQVNYIGLIGRMGTRIQSLQRTVDAQATLLAAMEARLAALEAA